MNLLFPRLYALLTSLGINTIADLQKKGALAVFTELKARKPGLTAAILWRLYALERQIPLAAVTPELKQQLRQQLRSLPIPRILPSRPEQELFMRSALTEAKKAAAEDEVPIGAVVVKDGKIIGSGFNRTLAQRDMTAHAEITALRTAARNCGNHRLTDCALYVTVEPCLMCLGAAIEARIGYLFFGAPEPKTGVIVSNPLSKPLPRYSKITCTGGILAAPAAALMTQFFRHKRNTAALK